MLHLRRQALEEDLGFPCERDKDTLRVNTSIFINTYNGVCTTPNDARIRERSILLTRESCRGSGGRR